MLRPHHLLATGFIAGFGILTACNPSKNPVTVEKAPVAARSDDQEKQTTDAIQSESETAVALERVKVEPKCPIIPPARVAQGKSTPNAAGDYLNSTFEIYTGFDGKHSYKVPGVVGYILANVNATAPDLVATPPTIKVDDPSIITVAYVPTPADRIVPPANVAIRFFMITTKKAGTANITFTYGAHTTISTVHVAAYTPEQYELGKKRYLNPDQPQFDRKACTSCHNLGKQAVNGTETPDHDPYVQGLLSEPHLQLMAAFGKECDDKGVASDRASYHQWHFTAAELDALPAYLRAMPPIGF